MYNLCSQKCETNLNEVPSLLTTCKKVMMTNERGDFIFPKFLTRSVNMEKVEYA
jgi:hypothetical protein